MRLVLIVLGAAFLALAVVYFMVPASALPQFIPGFEPGSVRIRMKHGLASLAVSAVLFGTAWFQGRRA